MLNHQFYIAYQIPKQATL